MIKKLTKIKSVVYYYKAGKKIIGVHKDIRGNVSGISGNVSGISGNVSDISGNVDLCKITEKERKAGIDIEKLIVE